MIEFTAFTQELRRIVPITYFSDQSVSVEQLAASLVFKGKLKNSSKQLPKTILQLNSVENHDYAKVVKLDILQYLTQHMVEDTIQIMLIKKQQDFQFPYAVVSKDQSDFEAVIRNFKKQFDFNLLSNNEKDILSVLLGKYDKNINCETLQRYSEVYISCHAFLILETDQQLFPSYQNVEWIDVKSMVNYDSLRTMRTQNPQLINDTLRHSSFVSNAAKRKAKSIEFTFLLINDRKLKGIFLQLWLYAIQVMIQGSHSKYHKKILSDYIKKAHDFDITFRWYHPFGFLMKYNAKTNYQKLMQRFSYKIQKGQSITPYFLVGGITLTVIAFGLLGYKKWKKQ